MRMSRILVPDVWYKIFTAVNRHEPIFQDRDAVDLFNRTLLETGERFPCEVRSLVIQADSVSFYIKPADGLQLPEIMQWLKQMFAVRYNVMKGLDGHLWGDRYQSEIVDGEPPEEGSAVREAGSEDCAGSDGEGSAACEVAGGEVPKARLERGPPDGDSHRTGETAENTRSPPLSPRPAAP
ncbi:MAG: transposase [Spirochaetaceae bacterium]|nr:transposase [Spirochaetaceae bacterium]